MNRITIQDLRHQAGKVLDRVLAGESLVITRAGRPVAELRPVPRPPLRREDLLSRWKALLPIDADSFRRDVDGLLDPSLEPGESPGTSAAESRETSQEPDS